MSSRSSEIGVEPKVLAWARESMGLSIEEVAKQFNVSENLVSRWESGEKVPTLVQLEKLTSIYKRPLATFFLPEPPEEPPLPHDFRMLPKDGKKPFSSKTRLAIRRAWRLQSLAVELAESIGREISTKIGRANLSDDPERIASKTRDELGIDIQTQFNWRSDYHAFGEWRKIIQNTGVLVFQLSMPIEETRGFSLPGEVFPAIILNEKDHVRARTFTLFHEYAHLLLGSGGICDWESLNDAPEADGSVEKFCNHFAGAFLVPKDALLDHPLVRSGVSSRWSDDHLRKIAVNFKVSNEVILRRLVTFNRASWDFYRMKYGEWKKREKEEKIKEKAKEEEKKHLFSIDINFKQYLKEGSIDEFLINVFENNDLILSNDARITEKDDYWEIKDKKKIYQIKDNGVQLDIYKLRGRGRNIPRKCILENGIPFVSLVIDSYKREEITYNDVADFLEIRTKHIPQVEHLVEDNL